MVVDSFDPSAMSDAVSAEQVRQWLLLAERCVVDDAEGAVTVESAAKELVASLFGHGWDNAAADLSDAEIVLLIRLFTVGEMQHASWQVGAKSPVVPLVKVLKQRDAFDQSLARWIKANTTNRFLPHGDLSALL